MGNIIRINAESPHEKWLSMSNQGTDGFLELLLLASEEISLTPSQEKLVEFLHDQKVINDIAPGTAGFDIADMPWTKSFLFEDISFLVEVAEISEEAKVMKKAGFEPENEIIRSWLEVFRDMLKEFMSIKRRPC